MERVPVLPVPTVALLLILLLPAAAADSLSVTGTGGGLGIVKLLAQAARRADPETSIRVPPGIGTTGGVKAVLSGKLDIAVGGRPLREGEKAAGAVEVPLARSPFVFCGHRDVPVEDLSLRDAIDIYSGRKTFWPDGTPIRLVLRPEGESDVDILRGISKEMADAVGYAMRRTGMIVALNDRDAADTIENTPGAFGTLALGMVAAERRDIKVFSLNGVAPGAKTLADGRYPIEKRFSLVTVRAPSPAARRFLEFVRSREAAAVLAGVECVPVR
jgi:phosphate transport system substrate-binding protein